MPISLISMTNRPKKIKKSKKKILAREIPCFHPYIFAFLFLKMSLRIMPLSLSGNQFNHLACMMKKREFGLVWLARWVRAWKVSHRKKDIVILDKITIASSIFEATMVYGHLRVVCKSKWYCITPGTKRRSRLYNGCLHVFVWS